MSNTITQTQELWSSYHGSNTDTQVGKIKWGGLFFSIILNDAQQNWLFADLITPNIKEGWRIKTLKLRIKTERSPFGGIDKVGIRSAENVIWEFGSGTPDSPPLAITSFDRWQIFSLNLPHGPASFASGLGISIHLNNRVDTKQDPPPPLPPVRILISGFGVEFIK